ncbi:hypothetical protein ACFFX0_03730 [Citricoccus parietis]|uniref:Uncharacterized protein n=1 Tax=Citricoccus parietis TaxID=592307 RepID=A0ABV5FUK7_9MICC
MVESSTWALARPSNQCCINCSSVGGRPSGRVPASAFCRRSWALRRASPAVAP